MTKRFLIPFLLMLFFFSPLLWISQYNYPSGEDYYITVLAKKVGALEATKSRYFNGSGRYSYLFLQSLISSSDSWLTIYKIFPIALLLGGFGSVYYFVGAFLGPAFSNTALFTLSAALYTLLISFTPDITTGFYWLTTSIQYTGAVFTSLLIFSLYINLTRSRESAIRMVYALLIIVLIALIAGANEASALFLIAILGFINWFHIVECKRPPKWALAFLALSVMFGLVSFLSPGTRLRIHEVGVEFNLLKVLAGSIGLTFYLLTVVLTTTPLLLASIIYLAFLNANRDKLERPRSLLQGVRWYWVLLFMLLAVTAVNFVIFTAIGVNGLTDRLKNIYVYSIFFAWLLLMTTLFFDLSNKKVNFSVQKWIIGVLVTLIFGFLLTGYKLKLSHQNVIPFSSRSQRLFSAIRTKSVFTTAYLDILSGRAGRFYRQNKEREQQLINAKTDTVEFSLYSYVPETIFIQDVNHPFGQPEWVTTLMCGKVKHLKYVETGPQVPPEKKF